MGAEQAKSDLIFLTGNDTSLAPNCLQILERKMRELSSLKVIAIAPRLIYERSFDTKADPDER